MAQLLNAVYAYLVERAQLVDSHRQAALLAKGVKTKDLEALSERAALDAWLNAPPLETQEFEKAALRELRGG